MKVKIIGMLLLIYLTYSLTHVFDYSYIVIFLRKKSLMSYYMLH